MGRAQAHRTLNARFAVNPQWKVALAACIAFLPLAASAGEWGRIYTEDEFRSKVVDRRLHQGGLELVARADGVLHGERGRVTFTSRWYWKDGLFCSEEDSGDFCLAIEIENGEVVMVSERGVRYRYVLGRYRWSYDPDTGE